MSHDMRCFPPARPQRSEDGRRANTKLKPLLFALLMAASVNASALSCDYNPPYPDGQGLFQCPANNSCFVGDGNTFPYVCYRDPDSPDSDYNPDGSPKNAPPPVTPAPLPSYLDAAAAAVAVAAGWLAGLSAFIGAPAIVPAVALGVALAAGVMAMPFSSSNPPVTPSNLDTVPPIKVTLAPTDAPTPQPGAAGGSGTGPTGTVNAPGAPAAVRTDPDGTFIPIGSKPYTSATDGGWEQTAPKEWLHYPPATATNPNPTPDAAISNGGSTVVQTVSKSPTGQATETLAVVRTNDNQTTIINSANVPVSGPEGNPALAQTHVATTYPGKTGASSTPTAPPQVTVNQALSDGTPVNSSSSMTVLAPVGSGSGGTGTGGTNGTTSGTGTGTQTGTGTAGGCTSGDCATETTQLANKATLKSIEAMLKGEGTAPNDPSAKTGADIKQAGISKASPAFTNLLGWRMPGGNAQCPTSSFTWNYKTYYFDAHCQLVANHFATLRAVMVAVYTISALFVVLKA